MEITKYIPEAFVKFILVLVFSLLIGLEQRRHHREEEEDLLFGTDRTYTFIGLLGYVLFLADQLTFIPFVAGFLLIGILLGIQYFQRILKTGKFGLTSTMLAMLTYCIPVMVFTQPIWLVLSFVVSLLLITEMKSSFISFSKKASEEEYITLATFITLAGVVLPLLPHENISEQVPVSAYHLWLAIIVVSGISYASYLLKKFVFPHSGVFITGLLGGLYSSTATTIILSRQAKKGVGGGQEVSAIMIANGMMYLRVLFLAFLFNFPVAYQLAVPFVILFVVCLALSRVSGRIAKTKNGGNPKVDVETANKNPLEFRTALIFGLLFVVFAVVTEFVLKAYGGSGVTGLAFIVGVTDIDPFLLNLLQHKSGIDIATVVLAILNATNSNNLIKMIYAISLGNREHRKSLITNFIILLVSGLLISFAIYYLF